MPNTSMNPMQQMIGNNPLLKQAPSILAPAEGTQTSSPAATKNDPYLNLCRTIQEKQPEIQEALVSKINTVFLNDLKKLDINAELIYNKITDLTSNLVIDQIKSMFPADNKNMRIMAFKLAKDAYMDTHKGDDNMFSANSHSKFNEKYNEQLETYLAISRVSGGGSKRMKGGDKSIKEAFDKTYSSEEFQKTILSMVQNKIDKIIQDKASDAAFWESIRPTVEKAKEVINTKLQELIRNLNNDEVMKLYMIKALGDEYILAYYKNPPVGKTLEQFIDDMILPEAENIPKILGGYRRRRHQKTKRRQYKRRRQIRSAKNIA